MNIIKGLIIKDLLQLKTYRKTLIIFVAIFILSSLSQDFDTVLMIMITLGFGMFSIASFSYDEMTKADKYIQTMPLTKKEIVKSKYFLVIGSTLLGAIIGGILNLVIWKFLNPTSNINPDLIAEFLIVLTGGIVGISLVEAIQIPCIYKWGAEKGRIQMIIGIAIGALLLGGVFYLIEKSGLNFGIEILEKLKVLIPIIMLLASVIIYYISYKIAYKIYIKKEQ